MDKAGVAEDLPHLWQRHPARDQARGGRMPQIVKPGALDVGPDQRPLEALQIWPQAEPSRLAKSGATRFVASGLRAIRASCTARLIGMPRGFRLFAR
jgi:hypothetical protein